MAAVRLQALLGAEATDTEFAQLGSFAKLKEKLAESQEPQWKKLAVEGA